MKKHEYESQKLKIQNNTRPENIEWLQEWAPRVYISPYHDSITVREIALDSLEEIYSWSVKRNSHFIGRAMTR